MFDFLNSRLSLSWRVALVAACAAPPIALLLYLFIGQSLHEAQFTDLELKGAAYIAEVWPAIVSGGKLVLPDSAPDAGEAGRRFHASDEEKAFLAAGKSRKVSAGADLIQAVADRSNLTLDTDLGSFYAMDAATVALPRLMSVLSILDSVSDPGERAFALGRGQAFEDAALRDLNETMAHDSSGGARRVLGAFPNRLSAAFADVNSHPENSALRQALTSEVDRAWRADQGQLVQMLQVRQTRLYQRFLRNLGLVALALGLTTALTIATTRGLAARLRVLLQTMDRLNVRDTTADIPYLSDRNETGRIAATLSAFKKGLIEADQERRRAGEANAAVRESEAQLRVLTENMSDIIVRHDRDGRRMFVSPSVRRIGYEPEELIGRPGFSTVHPDDRPDIDALVERMGQGDQSASETSVELRLMSATGEWAWMEGKPNPIYDADGELVETIWLLRDIQARKRAQDAIVESEARYRMLADNATDIIVHFSSDFRPTYASPSVRRYGIDPDNLDGVSSLAFVHPDDMAKVLRRREDAQAGMAAKPIDYRVRMPDGQWTWVESTMAPVVDDGGEITGFMMTVRDIGERKAAEFELIRSEARYRMLADNSTDIILSYGLNAETSYISPSVRQLGYTPKEFISLPHGSIIHPDDWPRIAERSSAIFRGEPAGTAEFRTRHADGHWVWLESSPAPVHDDTGAVVGIVSVLRDVSERKAAEAALQDVNAELSRIARTSALGAFAASIAHEVNQPLAAAVIDGETSLRWLSGDAPNLERAVRAIHRATDNARRASEVVGRLRAMMVKEQTQRADFELNKAIGEVLSLTAGESQRSKVTVTADLAANEPVVRGDRIQVQQVILNLVLNAIEAVREAPKGERLVFVRSSVQPNMDVEITVEDRGSGVSPENAERIFDNLFTTKIGGTGLGLPISKSIVEAHGGRMWVENAVPHGAVFRVQLPHGREAHAQPAGSRETVPAP